jgi:hypothetical protein
MSNGQQFSYIKHYQGIHEGLPPLDSVSCLGNPDTDCKTNLATLTQTVKYSSIYHILYSPSRPMRGNQAVLPAPQVRRPHPSNQGVGTGLGSIWDAGNPDRA